ncbi:alpha-tocopherol transfer protein-like [Daktulosphaira vitifoliae]|uniref:alpha-tocopherol transfer protein-like n=1 Tax=Daktulosphaira vitifoliae TaxID=58002 RepID=UPI0021A9E8B2|nr:alpha-tocopherol transfer protein-like [Daktulosphaira vitifoliae]
MYTPKTRYEDFLKGEQEKYPELNLEDIDALKALVKANDKLPAVTNREIILFLHSSYFNVEKAYAVLVNYFKYRKDIPQIFTRVDPLSDDMKDMFETMSFPIISAPYKGKEDRYVYTNFKKTDAKYFDYVKSAQLFFMVMDALIIQHGTFEGVILTMDAKHLNWRHLTKIPMTLAKRLMEFVQDGLPIRLKAVHIVNAGSLAITLFNLLKPFMRSHFLDIVTLHSVGSTEVFKYVPLEYMPEEMGGQGKSHIEYFDETYEFMCLYRDWLLNFNEYPKD